jgi:hypothetical protein
MSQLASAQHFIGLNKDETKSLARESGFYQDNMVVSQKFNYMKFVNSADTKTLIVFFSEEDISTHTRTVCDYSEFSYVVEDLDKNFRKITDTSWVYENEKQEYEVTLEEKEWYFVIRTKKK